LTWNIIIREWKKTFLKSKRSYWKKFCSNFEANNNNKLKISNYKYEHNLTPRRTRVGHYTIVFFLQRTSESSCNLACRNAWRMFCTLKNRCNILNFAMEIPVDSGFLYLIEVIERGNFLIMLIHSFSVQLLYLYKTVTLHVRVLMCLNWSSRIGWFVLCEWVELLDDSLNAINKVEQRQGQS
jgi:hypothetical protein